MLRNRRRWVVTSLVLVISAVAYVDRVNLSVAAPVLTKEFHTNAAVMGLLLSSFTWSYALLNIPAGMLVDRIRTRFLYSGAMLMWGVASFLTVLTNSVGALFGPRLLLGVAESPFIPASVRTLSDWLPKSERGAGGGVFISGIALGSAVGPPILAWLVSGHGWRSAFIATGVLSVVFAVGWFAWYRHPADDRRLSDEERELILADQEPDRPVGQARAPWSSLIRNRDIWAITGGYFCLLYIQYTFVSWVPSYLVQDRHMTVLKSGLATSIPWTCAFLVAVTCGRTSDVLMRRGWSALNARKVVLVGGMAAALAIVGTAFSSSATTAIVFLSISTSGIVLANGAAWAATQDVTRRLNLPGSASGFINGVSNVGGILGPIVTGALVYATSSFVVPLVVAAGVALAGGLIWLLGIRARPEQAVTTAAGVGTGVAAAGVAAAGAGVAGAGGPAAVAGVPVPGPRTTLEDPTTSGSRRLVLAGAAVVALIVAALALYPALRAHQTSPPPLAERDARQGAARTPAPAALGPGQPAQPPVPEAVPGQGGIPGQNPVPDSVSGQGAVPGQNPVPGAMPDQGAVPGSNPEPNQVRGSDLVPNAGPAAPNGPAINASPGGAPGGAASRNIHPARPANSTRSATDAQVGEAAYNPVDGGSTRSDDRHADGDRASGGGHRSGDGDGHGGSKHSDGRHGDGDNGSGHHGADEATDDSDTAGILGSPGLEIAPTGLVGGLLGQ